jgi:hypothetical protein
MTRLPHTPGLDAWGRDVAEGLRRFEAPPDWLLAMDDEDRIATGLRAWVPELRSGDQRLLRCEVVRGRPRHLRWTSHYRLVVASEDAERTIELRAQVVLEGADVPTPGPNDEPFGTEGWVCYVPELRLSFHREPPDDALVSLPDLMDPDRARPILERAMRGCSPRYADLRIRAVEPRVTRYKPGERCTVLYRMSYRDDGGERAGPDPVVAKTHHGAKGRTAHEAMTALWASPLRHSGHVAIPEPLGFLADCNVVVQGPIKEDRTLRQQIRAAIEEGSPSALADVQRWLTRTARGLAELHGSGVKAGDVWRFEDELGDVRRRVERLGRFVPALAGAGDSLLHRIEDLAATRREDPLVPSHHSFRPSQVLIHDDDMGFIDFDGFCAAEPALDLSLFVSVVWDLSLRVLQARDGRPAPGEPARPDHLRLLDELSETFVGGYERCAPVAFSRARVELWHALFAFDRVVTCWTKSRFERLPQSLSLLAHLYARDDLAKPPE